MKTKIPKVSHLHFLPKEVPKAPFPVPKPPSRLHRTVPNAITIEVRVYRLVDLRPVWHTGTRIRMDPETDHRYEVYFQITNRVECLDLQSESAFNAPKHRTLTRQVPGDWKRIVSVFDQVRQRWDGTRYDLLRHNCNLFTDDLLRSLGADGLDKEYVDSSGIRALLARLPGTATLQELFVKGPQGGNVQVDQAVWQDVKPFGKLLQVCFPLLPTVAALNRAEAVWPEFKSRPGNTIAGGWKYYEHQTVKAVHDTGNKISAGCKNAKKGKFKF